MGFLGGPRSAGEVVRCAVPASPIPRQARRGNISATTETIIYCAVAAAALATLITIDQIRTSGAREAAAEAQARDDALTAELREAEASAVSDIRGGRPVLVLGGIVRSDDMCLLDPIVKGRLLVLITAGEDGDPSSVQAFVGGYIDEPEEHDLFTTTVGWDAGRRAFVVSSPNTPYTGLAVGAALPADSPTDC